MKRFLFLKSRYNTLLSWYFESDSVQVVAFTNNTHIELFKEVFGHFSQLSCEIPSVASSITSFEISRVRGRNVYTSDLTYPYSHTGTNRGSDGAIEQATGIELLKYFVWTTGSVDPWLHCWNQNHLCRVPWHTLPFWGANNSPASYNNS